jgi:hypothetical protein
VTLYLLGGIGLVMFASGGWLAHAGHRCFARLDIAERVAGFLIIAGVGCIGAGLGLTFGPPL